MTREEILNKLNNIFNQVFDREITLLESTSAKDINGWDSLTHITIISMVEEEFEISFTMKQVLEMQNIGDMISIIEEEI
ncbi:MAG: phosphopantetheine-binding protein [Christensenella sp.]|nr:phosphopantetheine-binding protein [Christensenella sp.]